MWGMHLGPLKSWLQHHQRRTALHVGSPTLAIILGSLPCSDKLVVLGQQECVDGKGQLVMSRPALPSTHLCASAVANTPSKVEDFFAWVQWEHGT